MNTTNSCSSQLNDLKERYKKYAKVLVEEQSVDGVIGGLPFEKTEITARVPEEILYYVNYYQGFHQGYQILLCAMFTGEKKGNGYGAAYRGGEVFVVFH